MITNVLLSLSKRMAKLADHSVDFTQQGRRWNRNIHFAHIGKNAGTQIVAICGEVAKSNHGVRFIKHPHRVPIFDLPVNDEYFFSIRNPVSRFKSGFYSRKRMGQPRLLSNWTQYERVAFDEFDHANDLAEALFEPGELGVRAFNAIKSIRHTAQNQSDWLCRAGNIFAVRPPIWIIRQEAFTEDMLEFVKRAKLNYHADDLAVSNDEQIAHQNDYSGIPELSEKAKANLEKWYVQDFAFYDACCAWMKSQSGDQPK